jgi:hypothetical protein
MIKLEHMDIITLATTAYMLSKLFLEKTGESLLVPGVSSISTLLNIV